MADSIKDRFIEVNERIRNASISARREKEEVTLIVVTKGQPVEKILEVVKAGAINLGENYPEETYKKVEQINGVIHPIWHMIGHLQSRKIKLLYPNFELVHSIDSLALASKIDGFYKQKDAVCELLVEVNIAGEESKFGFDASSLKKRDDLLNVFEILQSFKNLRPRGLMTMPPYANQPKQNEEYYILCRELLSRVNQHFSMKHFTELSMGTSLDFETAISCGATFVRVGEAIMGKRNYNK